MSIAIDESWRHYAILGLDERRKAYFIIISSQIVFGKELAHCLFEFWDRHFLCNCIWMHVERILERVLLLNPIVVVTIGCLIVDAIFAIIWTQNNTVLFEERIVLVRWVIWHISGFQQVIKVIQYVLVADRRRYEKQFVDFRVAPLVALYEVIILLTPIHGTGPSPGFHLLATNLQIVGEMTGYERWICLWSPRRPGSFHLVCVVLIMGPIGSIESFAAPWQNCVKKNQVQRL